MIDVSHKSQTKPAYYLTPRILLSPLDILEAEDYEDEPNLACAAG